MARPCIHGDVCRAYIREKGCILCSACPECVHYAPAPTTLVPTVDRRDLNCCLWILLFIAAEVALLIELFVME